jgi:beta-galactosidase
LDFDGVNDYVDCGANTSLDITAKVTLSVWVKTRDSGNGQYNPFVAKGDTSYGLQHQNGNNIEFCIYDAGAWPYTWMTGVTSSFNGTWHHVAGTYDGSELKVYVDGLLRGTTAHTGAIATSTYAVSMGRNSQQTTRYYEGLIDEVRIYNRALSASEIAYLADVTPGDGKLHVPIQSPAELYSAEADGSQKVNFKDFAVLSTTWLEEKLWP